MSEVVLLRTPQIVAAEINSIKDQTRTMILCNSIEIGQRLVEAKSMVEHGEWGNWLEKSVDYKKSTANNLMKIFEEYGANQIALFGDNAKSQALGDLGYTQAIALLGVPSEEREQFIKENDIDSMSTRELQQAIKDREQAIKENEDLRTKLAVTQNNVKSIVNDLDTLRNEADNLRSNVSTGDRVIKDNNATIKMLQETLEKERKQSKSEVERLGGLLTEAKNNGSSNEKVKQLEDELEAAQDQVQELTNKINEPVTIEPVVVKEVPEEIEQELEQLRQKNKDLEAQAARQSTEVLKFNVYFDSLKSGFQGLLGSLAEIKEVDMEKYSKYKKAVNGLLGKMSEHL